MGVDEVEVGPDVVSGPEAGVGALEAEAVDVTVDEELAPINIELVTEYVLDEYVEVPVLLTDWMEDNVDGKKLELE